MSLATRTAVLSMHTSPLAPLGGATSGGMNVYVREISERLAARGKLIDVFTRRSDLHIPTVVDLAPGARLIQIEAGPATPLSKDEMFPLTDEFAARVEAFRVSQRNRYDLIHSHYWISAVAGEQLALNWEVPHLGMFHTLGEVKIRARVSEQESPDRLDAERRLAQSLDCIVAATGYEQRLLQRVYGVPKTRVAVIPLGVASEKFFPDSRELARAQLKIPLDEQVVLAVGRIEPLKGIDILIRGMALITDKSKVRLLIVGGDEEAGPEFDRLTAIADEVGVRDLLTFAGSVPHDQMPNYYRSADVVVMPSFSESFGLVAVEAMASGVPVVVSRVGGLASTVVDGRTGYLIPWRCPEPFAEKIDLLLRNDSLRKALGTAGVERMRAYSWDSVSEQLADLYDEILGISVAQTTSVVGG